MPLPPRTFWTIAELAARWDCHQADIAGWAARELLALVTTIPPATAGEIELAGLVEIHGADILPVFRREDHGPTVLTLHRARPLRAGDDDWLTITEPSAGVDVDRADILVEVNEAERFESEWEMNKRGPGGPGGREKHDWESFYIALTKRIYEGGLPAAQSDLVHEMQDWFVRRSSSGDAPDMSTIRRRIKPIWHALKEEA